MLKTCVKRTAGKTAVWVKDVDNIVKSSEDHMLQYPFFPSFVYLLCYSLFKSFSAN